MKIYNKLLLLLNSESIKGKFLKSAGILSIAGGLEKGARLLRNMLIARILAPEQFGLMAIVLAVTWATRAFSQVGVQQVIIQHKKGEERGFLRTAWSVSFVFSVVIYITGFFAAPFIAGYYKEEMLVDLLRVSLTVIILNGLISPKTYTLEKRMNFKRWVVIMQGAGIFNVVTAVVLSLVLENVWALVLALVGESLFKLAASYILCPFRPGIEFSREYRKDIYRFGKGIIGLPVLMLIYQQIDIFFLGRMVPKEDVGKYHLALALGRIPYMIYVAGFSKLMLPLLSKYKDDPVRFKKSIMKITANIASYGTPFVTFLIIFRHNVLALVYGEEYTQAGDALGFLSLYFFINIFCQILAGGYIALSKPDQYRNFSVLRLLTSAGLLYPLIAIYGITGAGAAMMVSTGIFWVLLLTGINRLTEIRFREYIGRFSVSVLFSFLIIGYGIILSYMKQVSDLQGIAAGAVVLLINWIIIVCFSTLRLKSCKKVV